MPEAIQHPRPDSAPRKARPWLWIMVAAMLGVLLMLIVAGAWHARRQAELDAALAEIDKSGAPTTLAELEQFYVAPPADEDATQLWLDGSAPLMLPAFGNAAKGLPFVGDGKVPTPGTPWDDLAAAEKLLAQYHASLALLHQAAALGGRARYPTQFSQGITMPVPHLNGVRCAYRLLALEAHVRAHRGDASGVARAVEAMLGLGRSLENEPLTTSLFVRMACDETAWRNLTTLLPQVSFSDQELIRLQDRLAQIEYDSGLHRALLGERVLTQHEINNLSAAAVIIKAGARQVHLDFMQRMLAATQQPWPRALLEVRQVQAELKATVDDASKLGKTKYMLVAPAGEALQAAVLAVGRNRARNDAALAAIAIERYRRVHSALPETLAQLVPDFMAKVPFDPFSGQPLKYVPGEGEYLIYNVGADGVDNGGQGDDSGKPDDVLRVKTSPADK